MSAEGGRGPFLVGGSVTHFIHSMIQQVFMEGYLVPGILLGREPLHPRNLSSSGEDRQ